MKVLMVGGAGSMASGSVRDMVASRSRHIEEIIVADTSLERARGLTDQLGDPRLKPVKLDVGDSGELRALLQRVDVCVNAVPVFAGHHMAIFHACFEARRTYVDFGGMGVFTVKQKGFHDEWRRAGLIAILGLGADPGISNVICKAVAERLDRIDKINLYWAAKRLGPDSPVLVPPYALSTVLGEYTNPSMQFLVGAHREVAPQQGEETLELPEPFGRTTFIFTQHSEPLTVPLAEGIRDKGIREFTWSCIFPRRTSNRRLKSVQRKAAYRLPGICNTTIRSTCADVHRLLPADHARRTVVIFWERNFARPDRPSARREADCVRSAQPDTRCALHLCHYERIPAGVRARYATRPAGFRGTRRCRAAFQEQLARRRYHATLLSR